MTVKLVLLKSGEDIVADVKEMVVGTEEDQKVVGYFLKDPCIVGASKMEGNNKLKISMQPWVSLSKDRNIPVINDWVISIVEPIDVVKEMYETQVVGEEKND